MSGWEAIRAEVLARIRRRDWPPGELIPGEEDLAREFGVARATVNRALGELAREGLLERRRKAGTRVAALPVRKATLDIPVIRAAIEARGQHPSHRLLLAEPLPLPKPVAGQLGVPAGGSFLYLETLHLADEKPEVLETRWLNPAVLPDPRPDFAAISVNEWLVGNVPFASGEIAFSAENATPREAELLACAPGAALFVTQRTTYAERDPITLVRLAHAPGYRLHTLL